MICSTSSLCFSGSLKFTILKAFSKKCRSDLMGILQIQKNSLHILLASLLLRKSPLSCLQYVSCVPIVFADILQTIITNILPVGSAAPVLSLLLLAFLLHGASFYIVSDFPSDSIGPAELTSIMFIVHIVPAVLPFLMVVVSLL